VSYLGFIFSLKRSPLNAKELLCGYGDLLFALGFVLKRYFFIFAFWMVIRKTSC